MANPDKQLLTTLHTDYYPMVFQVCKGFVKGDVDVAKDLAQDVFVNTWNALGKFQGASSYKTWIYRITVNTCLKFLRDRKDLRMISIDELSHHPSEKLKTREDDSHGSLYHAIGQLTEIDRLIMMMVLDELDYEEIASVIGISNANLRVKIHRIKKELKEILAHG